METLKKALKFIFFGFILLVLSLGYRLLGGHKKNDGKKGEGNANIWLDEVQAGVSTTGCQNCTPGGCEGEGGEGSSDDS